MIQNKRDLQRMSICNIATSHAASDYRNTRSAKNTIHNAGHKNAPNGILVVRIMD